MKWTDQQQRVIDESPANILVSAAAGSGKTAVLVERILKRVTDKKDPAKITDFLVVTFTKAAAAQMKEKLAAKLAKALEESPENEHLMQQVLLVNRADITTIDSFCYKLVRENFSLLDLDAAIAVGDQGAIKLLSEDVLKSLFEEKYESTGEEKEHFLRMLALWASDRDDEGLKDEIRRIFHKAESYPDPDKWLSEAEQALMVETAEELEALPWVKKYVEHMRAVAADIPAQIDELIALCQSDDGPAHYAETLTSDIEHLEHIMAATDLKSLSAALAEGFARLASKRNAEFDKELAESIKNARNAYKDRITKADLSKKTPEQILTEIRCMREQLLPLFGLVREFSERFFAAKKKRRMLDFSDIAHMAFRLVVAGYDEAGHAVPTELGRAVSERYREIYIDDYQESNYLQEDVLTAVSRAHAGTPNMFMVGDVKQSIYRFRNARPELFVGKYNTYGDKGENICIRLQDNFRSRACVLDAANYFFRRLMGKDLGGIAYDKKAELVTGMKYPDHEPVSDHTEVHLIDYTGGDSTAVLETDKLPLEAELIADRIEKITGGELFVYDTEIEKYRLAEYRDCVILVRSIKDIGETFANVLRNHGIPVMVDGTESYFDAVEVRVLLSLVKVIDNAYQDIPMAAVLLSPIAGITETELARISYYAVTKLNKTESLYERCTCYALDHEDETGEKLSRFLEMLDDFRQKKTKLSVSELIYDALVATGYLDYVTAMPQGSARRANLEKLLSLSREFEDGYYKGLFHFLRYMDRLELSEQDPSAAESGNVTGNVVTIMTMHKSKGLEYPVCFVSALGKQFNVKDTQPQILISSDDYVASSIFDLSGRYRHSSFMRDVFAQLSKTELRAEEIRILYVALTRAREKLILTGVVGDLTHEKESVAGKTGGASGLLPYGFRLSAKSPIELFLACLPGLTSDVPVRVYEHDYEELTALSVKRAVKNGYTLAELAALAKELDKSKTYDKMEAADLFRYPYAAAVGCPSKLSVSEIKRRMAEELPDEQPSTELIGQEAEPGKPEGLSGAQRGTLVHRFMELLEFRSLPKEEAELSETLARILEELIKTEVFSKEEAEAVNLKKIGRFLCSPLGKRMQTAAEKDVLFKERQFSAGFSASEICGGSEGVSPEDIVVVQGIIDAYFLEGDDIVLMDYKTDHADAESLINRYHGQLDYYAKTLERLTGKTVKEKLIYSFHLNTEIPL